MPSPEATTGADGDEAARIVEAAWQLLQRTGFQGLKVQRVVRAAGVSTRTFYRHFHGKDDLLRALLREEVGRVAARLERLIAAADGPEAKVGAWIDGMIGAAYQPAVVPRARLWTRVSRSEELGPGGPPEENRILRTSLVAVIEEGRVAGAFPGADPAVDAMLIHALCMGTVTQALADDGVRPADAVALTTRFALAALRAPAAGPT